MAYIIAPDFKIRSIDWTLSRPSQVNVSAYTGRRSVVANPWFGKWSARVELAPMVGDDNVRLLRSFIAGVEVSSTAIAGATTMGITGADTDLLEGQMVTVNGQLLQLTDDQSGANLTFQPPLREEAASGTRVVTRRPYALVSMTGPDLGVSVGLGPQYGISFDAGGCGPRCAAG